MNRAKAKFADDTKLLEELLVKAKIITGFKKWLLAKMVMVSHD